MFYVFMPIWKQPSKKRRATWKIPGIRTNSDLQTMCQFLNSVYDVFLKIMTFSWWLKKSICQKHLSQRLATRTLFLNENPKKNLHYSSLIPVHGWAALISPGNFRIFFLLLLFPTETPRLLQVTAGMLRWPFTEHLLCVKPHPRIFQAFTHLILVTTYEVSRKGTR